MTVRLGKPRKNSIAIHTVDRATFAVAPAALLDLPSRRWLQTLGFTGAPDTHALQPAPDGRLQAVWAGVRGAADPWALALLPKALPPGQYHLAQLAPAASADATGIAMDAAAAAMSWELGGYAFDLYKPARREPAELTLPGSEAAQRGLILAGAIASTRDLVNTPAEDLGPAALAEAVRLVARQHGARFKQTVGDTLLTAGFPAIHAVGRAADAASG
ncbi:MAG: leucyl aminopeptidase family protein, partial [Rubrivivax sp.]|nr:leucyl aminopeptidase family protein [Rubrivivax sp.]